MAHCRLASGLHDGAGVADLPPHRYPVGSTLCSWPSSVVRKVFWLRRRGPMDARSGAQRGDGRDDVADFGATGVVSVHVDPSDDARRIHDATVGIGTASVPSPLTFVRMVPLVRSALRVSSPGCVNTPSAAATWFPGSDNTVNVRSFFSCIDSEPSGRCGLMAIGATPRRSSSGTRSRW